MGFLKKLLKPIVTVFKPLVKPLLKAIKKWLTPDLPEKEAMKIQRMGSDHAIPIIYGTRTTGAIIVDRAVSDSAGGLLNENYHVLAVFCYGEIDQFIEFFFNGVSWNDPRWTKNGVRYYDFQLATGSDTQTPLSSGTVFNRWNATQSHYKGLAIAIFTFKQDQDATIWNGEPQITATIRGKKCVDPRTPSAPATYTENPAVHLYDYVRSSVYGLGLTDGDIDLPSFVAVASIADTNETAVVDTKVCQMINGAYVCTGSPAETVTFKRFSHNNIIDTGRDLFSNVAEIANSFRGFFPDSDGRIKIAAEIEGASVFSFNADNIVSSITSTTPSIKDRSNRVVVRFPNVLNKYEMDECFYPAPDDPLYAQWLTEDNGLNLEKTITAEYTVYKAEALQLAEVAAKSSRNAETVQFTATAEAIQCDVGDIVDITEENRGWINKLFRISSVEYREDFLVNITAIQHDDAIYPWSDLDYSEIIGGTNLGDPANIPAPTNLVIEQDPTLATRGTLVWNYGANAFVRRYLVIILSGSTEIVRAETVGQSYVIPQIDTGTYSIQVYAISTIGATSPAASISFTLSIPLPPSAINTIAKNFDITVLPVLAGIGLGTSFEFAIGDTTTIRGRGASIVFTGLAPNTEYTIYARTVNALGVSTWASRIAATTNDGSEIVDLIGEDIAAQVLPSVVNEVTNNLTQIVADATADKLDQNQVQDLIDDSISFVNGGDVADARIDVVNAMQSLLSDFQAKDKISLVEFSVQQEGQIRQAEVLRLSAQDRATLERIELVQSDVTGNAVAISAVSADVKNPITGLSATFTLASQAKTTADGAATSVFNLSGTVNDPVTGLLATRTIAQSAKTTADGAAISVSEVSGTVNNPTTGLSATFTLAQQAKATADGALSSATAVTNTVNNPATGLSATATVAQQAKAAADGAADSILLIQQSITDIDGDITSVSTIANRAQETADGAVESITEIGGAVNDPATGLSATRSLAQSAKNTADGAVVSITEIRNDVKDVENGLSVTTQTAQKALIEAQENDIAANAAIGNIVSIMDNYQNKVTIQSVNFAVLKEGNIRAQQVVELNAANQSTVRQVLAVATDLNGTNTALSQLVGEVRNPTNGLSASFTLAQSAKTTADGAASSASEISGAVNNPNNGLAASYSIATQAKSTADNALNSATSITNTVNNPTTGLAATATIAQQAKTTADNALSSATSITNTVNNPTTGLSATATVANAAKFTADGNTTAINGLNTRVQTAEGDIATATIGLESVTNSLGAVSARAYLGVTTTVGGVSRINGIVVDGATNALEFRADTLRLSDTDGVTQLYWDTDRSKWIYKGDLVAGTFQTALTGYRAEMSGAGTIPFWYGTGERNWSNALFAVDSSGNVKISNAQMQGAFVSTTSGARVEINTGDSYLIWAGSGAKSDANGTFWIKQDGTGFIKGAFFQGQIIESKVASDSATNSSNLTATIANHDSAGKPIDLQVNGFLQCSAPANQSSKTLRASVTVTHDSGQMLTYDRFVNGIYDAEFAKTEWYIDYPNFVSRAFSAGVNTFQLAVVYSFSANPTGGLSVANNSCSIRTFENKIA